MKARVTLGIVLSAIAILAGGCASITPPTEKELVSFSSVPDSRKGEIVAYLLDQRRLNKAENKQVCADVLATQARFASTNASAATIEAISAVDRNGWADLVPSIRNIMEEPLDIWVYEAAFRYLRAQDGRPIPVHIIEDTEILHRAGLAKTDITDRQLDDTKKRLIAEKDKEPVFVYVITVGARKTRNGIARGRNAAAYIISNMDRAFVQKELAKFKGSEDLRWLTDRLGWE